MNIAEQTVTFHQSWVAIFAPVAEFVCAALERDPEAPVAETVVFTPNLRFARRTLAFFLRFRPLQYYETVSFNANESITFRDAHHRRRTILVYPLTTYTFPAARLATDAYIFFFVLDNPISERAVDLLRQNEDADLYVILEQGREVPDWYTLLRSSQDVRFSAPMEICTQ